MYIDSSKEINEDTKFKIGDIVRILNHKNIFAKGYVPNWSEEVFVIKKLKTLCRGHMLLVILKMKKLLESFMKKNYKFTVEKIIKRKDDKLYVKCKGYNNSFNSYVDKKRHSIND